MSKLVAETVPEMADDLEEWFDFGEPLEGRVYSLYSDIKGLVTTGVGNLVEPINLALQLPWRIHNNSTTPAPPDAPLAPRDQVVTAWHDINDHTDTLKRLHWKYAARRNRIRLSEKDVDELVKKKLFEFEAYMEKRHFSGWRDFPADAQLAICSMAWACGPGFPRTFSNFTRFANKNDWSNAALCAKIRETGNPGIVPRNKKNKICFENAAIVVANEMDRDVLHWPGKPVPQGPETKPMAPSIDTKQPELIPLEVPWDDIAADKQRRIAEMDE